MIACIKRVLCVVVLFLLMLCQLLQVSSADSDEPAGISAKAAALIIADTGEVVFARNENERLGIASTTKIMTSLLALEYCNTELEITVTEDVVRVEGTSMGLLAGDIVGLTELVYGMLLQSGNDAANAAAVAVGGSIEAFCEQMNARARSIGMSNTHFTNPSGLWDDEHYSSAYDMALLGAEALRNESFAQICSSRRAVIEYGNPPYSRTLTNHNKLLSLYEYAVGIKTGFTKKSGRCLVSAARRDGITLVCVTLNAPDDWNDHISLYEYGFSKVSCFVPDNDFSDVVIPVTGGIIPSVTVKTESEPVCLTGAEADEVTMRRVFTERFLYAPVVKGSAVGRADYYIGGTLVESVRLLAEFDVELTEETSQLAARYDSGEAESVITRIVNKIKECFYG